MFMSSMLGNPGAVHHATRLAQRPKRLTYSNGANTSPSWNPKTGQQVAFVSDRGGIPQLYTMNSDGSSQAKVDLPDMGYVIDPAWSPNGQLLAFSWRRPNGNYDLYVMEIVTRQLGRIDARCRPKRAAELGSRWAPSCIRIHANGNAADLVHAG